MTGERSNEERQEYEAARLGAMNAWRQAAGALRQYLGVPDLTTADGYEVRVGCVVDDLGRMSEQMRHFFLVAEPAVRVERDALAAENKRLRGALSDEVDNCARAEAAADQLAYTIGTVAEIGEHSSLNDPWERAADLAASLRSERDAAEARAAALQTATEALAEQYERVGELTIALFIRTALAAAVGAVPETRDETITT